MSQTDNSRSDIQPASRGPYLVTGAAGFIGSTVAELLLDEGCRVVGVDNLNDAYDVRLKQWRLSRLRGRSGFEFRQLNICDRCGVEELFMSQPVPFAGTLNLAARAGVRSSVEDPREYLETNVTGTLNLIQLSLEHGVRKFVLASTSSLYGENNPTPFSEDANTDRPLSPYAASKKAAEALCYSYHHLFGLDVSVLRYFTVYGPAGRPDMSVLRFVQRIREGRQITVFGDGAQQRDFTYVGDIARGTVAALRPVGYEVINLGSDQPASVCQVIGLVERALGRRAEIAYRDAHLADVSKTWADITKARDILAWEPEVSLEDGVRRVVEWYETNRQWASTICTN